MYVTNAFSFFFFFFFSFSFLPSRVVMEKQEKLVQKERQETQARKVPGVAQDVLETM